MPTIDPKTGQISMTMEEFTAMQSTGGNSETKSGEKQSLADKWKSMFSPKPTANNSNQQQQQQQQKGPVKLTREALDEASKNLKFFQPTPEQLEKIANGDTAALMEAQNEALQKVFVDAAMASDALVNNSSTSSKADMEAMIQQQFARHESARTIKEKTSPFLETPGGDVLVSALTRQFSSANPDKAPAEIGDMVSGYLNDFSANFGNKAPQPNAREVALQKAQESATDF
jgi:hypothetical protein